MNKYKVIIHEYNRPYPIITYYKGKKMTNQELIDFFGLEDSDVKSYKIEDLSDENNN